MKVRIPSKRFHNALLSLSRVSVFGLQLHASWSWISVTSMQSRCLFNLSWKNEIHNRLPQGCGALSCQVVKLGRSLYRLRQASPTCHHHLVRGMKFIDVELNIADACVMRLIEEAAVVIGLSV